MVERKPVLTVPQPSKRAVAEQFGSVASAYASSASHASGSDLSTLIDMLDLESTMIALDVATGPGHTAFAAGEHVRRVVGTDLAEGMIIQARLLAAERGVQNVEFLVMDAENLEFPDGSFEIVTCRIAAHHFLDPERAVGEMARVLRPGGRLGLEDNIVPEDSSLDSFLNELERLRDPVHVRAHSVAEWREMLAGAGLLLDDLRFDRARHDVEAWLARTGIDESARDRVREHLRAAKPSACKHYLIEFDGDRPVSYTDDKVLLRAVKPL